MQVETCCPLCCAWGALGRATRHTEVGCYLFGVYGPLRGFGNVCCMNQNRLLCGGAAGRSTGWASSLVGVGSQDHQLKVNSVS